MTTPSTLVLVVFAILTSPIVGSRSRRTSDTVLGATQHDADDLLSHAEQDLTPTPEGPLVHKNASPLDDPVPNDVICTELEPYAVKKLAEYQTLYADWSTEFSDTLSSAKERGLSQDQEGELKAFLEEKVAPLEEDAVAQLERFKECPDKDTMTMSNAKRLLDGFKKVIQHVIDEKGPWSDDPVPNDVDCTELEPEATQKFEEYMTLQVEWSTEVTATLSEAKKRGLSSQEKGLMKAFLKDKLGPLEEQVVAQLKHFKECPDKDTRYMSNVKSMIHGLKEVVEIVLDQEGPW